MSNLINGSGRTQVPKNLDLGDLAYQNADSIEKLVVKNFTSDKLDKVTSIPNVLPTLNLNFTTMDLVRNAYVDPRVSFSRSSSATVWKLDANNKPILATVEADVPRYEIDPVTGDVKGLLIETSRTNIFLHSSNFLDALWDKVYCDFNTTTVVINPDGTVNDLICTGEPTTQVQYTKQDCVLVAGAYTMSVYAKAAGINNIQIAPSSGFSSETFATFNLATGQIVFDSVGTAKIQSVGDGWYRCSLTQTASATSAGRMVIALCPPDGSSTDVRLPSFLGSSTEGVRLWGAQMELGEHASSYIPTTTSTATRSPDLALISGTNLSSWYNQIEGTMYADAIAYNMGATSSEHVFTLTQDGDNRFGLYKAASTKELDGYVEVLNSANGLQTSRLGIFIDVRRKIAQRLKANNHRVAVQGILGELDTTRGMPTNVTYAGIGCRGNDPQDQLNGHIRNIKYFNFAFSDDALVELTR